MSGKAFSKQDLTKTASATNLKAINIYDIYTKAFSALNYTIRQ